MNKALRLLILLITILASSCSSPPANIDDWLPNMEVPEKNFNSKIVLQNFPGEPQSYKVGDSLAFGIINKSAYNITFNNDFDLKLFMKHNDVWEPINNQVEYPEGERILLSKNIDPTGLVLFVLPDLSEIKSSTTIRIAIIGEVEGKSEKVGAYIDVQYIP